MTFNHVVNKKKLVFIYNHVPILYTFNHVFLSAVVPVKRFLKEMYL